MASQVEIETTVTVSDCGVWLFERDCTVTIEYTTDGGEVYDWYPIEFTITDDRVDKKGRLLKDKDGKFIKATVHVDAGEPLFALLKSGLDDDWIFERVCLDNSASRADYTDYRLEDMRAGL